MAIYGLGLVTVGLLLLFAGVAVLVTGLKNRLLTRNVIDIPLPISVFVRNGSNRLGTAIVLAVIGLMLVRGGIMVMLGRS